MNSLRAFAPYWHSIQRALFPHLERVLGPLTEKQRQLVQTLEVIRIEQMIPPRSPLPGRPPKVHPRAGGEHLTTRGRPNPTSGSSPLLRGSL